MADQQEKNPSKWKKYLVYFSITALIALAATVYFRYYFIYNEGVRVGLFYKFDKKGTFFKTYEGVLELPTVKQMSSELFYFSVTDKELATKMSTLQGKKLEVHFVQYLHCLPWRGQSYKTHQGQYIVDKILKVEDVDNFGEAEATQNSQKKNN